MLQTRNDLDRAACLAWWKSNRARTRRFFREILAPEAYYDRPIALRNPFVFYDGHLAAFAVNTLIKRALGRKGIDEAAERLFERGIDPADAGSVTSGTWPPRERVEEYVAAADEAVQGALENAELVDDSNPCLARGQAVLAVLEHEPMHQETLLYMLHRTPYEKKRRPEDAPPLIIEGEPPARRTVRIPAGCATLGADPGEIPFGWDNEFPSTPVAVPAFSIDVHSVTNADYLEFVEAGGYRNRDPWTADDWEWKEQNGVAHPVFWERREGTFAWRGQFEEVPLPPAWPVYVSHAEAAAYARFRGERLPTEAEIHRAAFGDPGGRERPFPWGDAPPDATRGNFDWAQWDPVPAGSFPQGASAWGVHDLVGNGWEWTSTQFAGFPGFRPMASYPVYSTDFFDGHHFVMKGASPATAKELVRRSLRNWFQPHYPYPYAKFRCVT